jgi:DNA-binding NtrC family response regulator
VVVVDTSVPEPLGSLREVAGASSYFSPSERRQESVVLLLGESGDGKKLIAQVIHELGDASGPLPRWIAVLCLRFLQTSFSVTSAGVHQRRPSPHGAFTRAGGTLFLDGNERAATELQRRSWACWGKRFRRVGGEAEIPCDVRIISATNRDLRAEVNESRFRLDLFYRLAVVTVRVPSLRERRGDIPILVEHFLREAGHEGPVEEVFSAEEMSRLVNHHWPGNIRELRNVVEASMVVGATEATRETTATPPSAGRSAMNPPR